MGIFRRLYYLEHENRILKNDISFCKDEVEKFSKELCDLRIQKNKLRDEIWMLENYIKKTSNDDYFVENLLDVENFKLGMKEPPTAMKIYHKGSIFKIPTSYEIKEPYVSNDEENKIAGIITIKSKVSDVVAIVDLRHGEILEIRDEKTKKAK